MPNNKYYVLPPLKPAFTLIELLVACHPKHLRRKAIHGFTLIELLVVIAIIAILVTIAIASFTSAQAKGRDARRKGDLDAIKKALELAKGDSTGAAYYPGCTVASCRTSTAMVPPISTTYITVVPQDPSYIGTASNYWYNPSTTASNTAQTYTLWACLENTNDTGTNTTSSASFASATCKSGQRVYVINNP